MTTFDPGPGRPNESRSGPMPPLDLETRPSGALLGIYGVPDGDASLAPFTLARIQVPIGVTTAEDHHEVREIWVIESGSGELRLDGKPMRASAGMSLFYDSFVRHQLHNDGDVPVDIVSIWWQP